MLKLTNHFRDKKSNSINGSDFSEKFSVAATFTENQNRNSGIRDNHLSNLSLVKMLKKETYFQNKNY